MMLHKILTQVSFGTGFLGLAGLAGAIEQTVTNMDSVYSAIAFVAVSAITGIWAYLESGQKNRPRHRGK